MTCIDRYILQVYIRTLFVCFISFAGIFVVFHAFTNMDDLNRYAQQVGGMGMAACAEIGDRHGLFQPAHGSAPDIAGRDLANPLAAILSGALMLDYLAEKSGGGQFADARDLVENAVAAGFAAADIRPMEFGGDQGTHEVTRQVLSHMGA